MPAALQTFAFWRDPHAYLNWCRGRYGPTFTIRPIGMPAMVFMSQPRDIESILRAPPDVLHPGAGAATIAPLVGAGSFMLAEEDEHLRGRRRIMPAFHSSVVERHEQEIDEIVAREVARWPRAGAIAIHSYLRALTLRVILRTIFGREDARIVALHGAILAMLAVTASLVLQEGQLSRIPGWRGAWRRFLADRALVDQIVLRLIDEAARKRTGEGNVVSMLLDASERSDDRARAGEVRDTLMSLIVAGHETTAAELAWAFQLLAHHRGAAQRLAEDLDGGSERYLRATIQEVLRHRPVFLFVIPRVVRQPYEIAGVTYRPPLQLVGCIHLMHHDPDLYPQPERFRPERFLRSPPRRELWSPWGGGRKRCPGSHLAMLEMRAVLRAVLSQLSIEPARKKMEIARWRSVIVAPSNGSRVILRERGSVASGHFGRLSVPK